ncbi:unnamed protein product [Arabis nemorensis]|uniref:Uncharacterized protein n=1 Tax=Arabis nemorensis TaxID=586526 RepID=A0A565C1A2_9BRAS|nr:unnamed protein product [Arabis nemorensis]
MTDGGRAEWYKRSEEEAAIVKQPNEQVRVWERVDGIVTRSEPVEKEPEVVVSPRRNPGKAVAWCRR